MRGVLVMLGALLAACGDDPRIDIVPDRFETVVLRAHGRGDRGAHQITILVPAGYARARDKSGGQRWSKRHHPDVTLTYGRSPQHNFELARDVCGVARDRHGELYWTALPDGFMVLCGDHQGPGARPTSLFRFIRVDDALLTCSVGLAGVPEATVRGAWTVCESVVVRAPHSHDAPPGDPAVRWTMEYARFDDGWTGWRTHRHPIPQNNVKNEVATEQAPAR